jgi:hypothetical protein
MLGYGETNDEHPHILAKKNNATLRHR